MKNKSVVTIKFTWLVLAVTQVMYVKAGELDPVVKRMSVKEDLERVGLVGFKTIKV